jgi:hypothetical protein
MQNGVTLAGLYLSCMHVCASYIAWVSLCSLNNKSRDNDIIGNLYAVIVCLFSKLGSFTVPLTPNSITLYFHKLFPSSVTKKVDLA